jgi:branched-chain amino acid transport system substrate-binding protein
VLLRTCARLPSRRARRWLRLRDENAALMSTRRSPPRIVAGFAAAVLLAALPVLTQAQPAPVDITAVLPLSGQGSFAGKGVQTALSLLEGVVNKQGGIKGRPVHFVYLDDQSNPSVSVQLTNDLIAKGGQFMLGPGVAASCKATEPLLKTGPVQFCQSPAVHPAKNSYLFSASLSSADAVSAMVRFARLRGWNRIGWITSTDAVGQDGDAALDAALAFPENASLHVVRREHFNPSDLSVTAQMSNIKAASPQVVFLWTAGIAFGTLLHGVADSGMNLPYITSGGNMTFGQMRQFTGITPNELYFPGLGYITDTLSPGAVGVQQKLFRDALHAAGVVPDFQSALLWDPALIYVDALRHLGPDAKAADIRDYIENLHGFAGICGLYDFRDGNQRGLTADNVLVLRWDNPKSDWVVAASAKGTK